MGSKLRNKTEQAATTGSNPLICISLEELVKSWTMNLPSTSCVKQGRNTDSTNRTATCLQLHSVSNSVYRPCVWYSQFDCGSHREPNAVNRMLTTPWHNGIHSKYTSKCEYLMASAAHKFLTKTYLETKELCNLRVGHWTLITEILIWYMASPFCSTNDKTPAIWAITGTTLSCQPTFSWSVPQPMPQSISGDTTNQLTNHISTTAPLHVVPNTLHSCAVVRYRGIT